MRQTTQSIKELYEKDFYLWVQENLRLLKNRELDLVDWENLLEEIEYMGQRYLDSAISHMKTILEHLHKWEHFRYRGYVGRSWIKSINNARDELRTIFERHPSVKAKVQEKETLQTAWKLAVYRLIDWFQEPQNHDLAKKYFGKLPTEEDFPQECHYTFEQVMEYKPWVEEFTQQEPEEPEKNKSENKREGFKGLEP
jgi:hypothetical protein